MKNILVSLLFAAVITNSLSEVHKKYADNVQVNLKKYNDTNNRLNTDLNNQVKLKTENLNKGNKLNSDVNQISGYIKKWRGDIANTQKNVETFQKNATTTRSQWNQVKATQKMPDAKPAPTPKKPATPVKKPRRLQKMAAKQEKTLESVNKRYREQIDNLTKTINEVIAKLRTVYAQAGKDDVDAAAMQVEQAKTEKELKTFLVHILEYINWTQLTVNNYHKLFMKRPDNLFENKTRKLIRKIKAVL